MRHLKAGKKLNRSPSHRKALYRNLAMALIRKERIITTKAKAQGVRPFVERLITLARRATEAEEAAQKLHYRRLAIARLGTPGKAEVKPELAELKPGETPNKDNADHRTIIQKLFDELGPRFAERPGGYTRIIKRHQRRLGDAGETVFLELLKEGEEKVIAKEAAEAPAPMVEEEEEEELTDEESSEEEAEDKSASEEAEEEDGEEAEDEEDETSETKADGESAEREDAENDGEPKS